MKNNVLERITNLPKMQPDELKALWRALYNSEPRRTNTQYMVKRLAYRLQELTYGGNSAELETRLTALADKHYGKRKKPKCTVRRPLPGTILVREYKGMEHQVAILEDGYQYDGCKYPSLSSVAKVITGTAWSGPAFFGLTLPRGDHE